MTPSLQSVSFWIGWKSTAEAGFPPRIPVSGMEHLWSQAGATGGKWERPKTAQIGPAWQPVATHGNGFGAHGKEGVDGSSRQRALQRASKDPFSLVGKRAPVALGLMILSPEPVPKNAPLLGLGSTKRFRSHGAPLWTRGARAVRTTFQESDESAGAPASERAASGRERLARPRHTLRT
jgi:hypothetical protein